MKIYLDDIRFPKTSGWKIARSFEEFCDIIKTAGEFPSEVSFDHDLGIGKTGYDAAKWMIEQDLDGVFSFPRNFKFNVHSANPIGAKNIQRALDNYLKFKWSL